MKTKVTLNDLTEHIREVFIGVATLGIVIICCAAVSIAMDFHAVRVEAVVMDAEMRTGLFARLDSALWKADTFLTVESGMSKSLSTGLTQVRVQVEQASSDQQQAIRSTATTAKATVEKTLEAAAQIQADVVQPAPVIHVAAPPPSPAPQVTIKPAIIEPAKPAPKTTIVEKQSHWRWLRWIWPFHARHK